MPFLTSIQYQVLSIKKFAKKNTKYQRLNTKYAKAKGFTLIELLIAIAILVILAIIVAILSLNKPGMARDAVRKSRMDSLRKALEFVKSEGGGYPACPSDASTCYLDSSNRTNNPDIYPEYVKPMPEDPINTLGTGANFRFRYTPSPSGCSGAAGTQPCYSYQIWTCLENSSEPIGVNVMTVSQFVCKSKRLLFTNPL